MESKIVVALKSIIVYNQKVLIIQRSNYDEIGAGTWEFVGGKLDFGEDLLDGLKREIKEEVSLDVTVERLLYATTFKTNPQRQVVILTYLCYANTDNINLSSEHKNYIWSNKEQLLELLPKPILNDLEQNHVLDSLEIF